MFSKEITQDESRPERCEVFGDDLLTTMVKRNPIVVVEKLSEDLIVFTRLCINSLNRKDFQTGSMVVMNYKIEFSTKNFLSTRFIYFVWKMIFRDEPTLKGTKYGFFKFKIILQRIKMKSSSTI
jgi:hypothetical protein